MSKWADKLRKTLLPLTLAFNVVAAPGPAAPPPPQKPVPQEETLWKTSSLDMVISLRQCGDEEVCNYIYWVNPDDSRIFDVFGDPKTKRAEFSFSAFEPRFVSKDDVLSVCGYSPKTSFHQVAEGKWKGTMELRGMGTTADLDVTLVNDNTLKVVSKLGLFRKTETWTRLDDNTRYPKCSAPTVKK